MAKCLEGNVSELINPVSAFAWGDGGERLKIQLSSWSPCRASNLNLGHFWRGYLDRTWTKCSSVVNWSENLNCIRR
jgi:hypothetical protein